jgi:hypothetical protein
MRLDAIRGVHLNSSVRFPVGKFWLTFKQMKLKAIKLPKSKRFACSAKELKAAFSGFENLGVYCGALGKSFEFDGRSKNRPKLEGTVVAQAQVSRELESLLILYPTCREEYSEHAANIFCDKILPQIREWIKSQLAKSQTAILGVETLIVEWTGHEHRKHEMRFL